MNGEEAFVDKSIAKSDAAAVDWPGLLREYAASKRSAKEFCRERGLKYSAFLYWRRKMVGSRRRAFVRVQAEETLSCKILLPQGLSITCPHLPEPGWLGQLLQEL
jgi:hypothetical protein